MSGHWDLPVGVDPNEVHQHLVKAMYIDFLKKKLSTRWILKWPTDEWPTVGYYVYKFVEKYGIR